MIFLWILLIVALLIAAILTMRVNLIFDFREKQSVYLRILFFRFDSNRFIDRFLSNDKKSGTNASEEINKKQENTMKKNKSSDPSDFIDFLFHLTEVIGSALQDLFSRAKVDLKELHVLIGTEDAANTALLCSSAAQAANGLCAVLQHFSRFRCNSKNLSISPNFTSAESNFSLHLVLSCPVIHLVGVYLRANSQFFN